MSTPALTDFGDRLAAVLERGRREGRLEQREIEALMLDPGFDADLYARFRADAARAGVVLPPEDEEEGAARLPVAVVGESDRDLLDLYLREIGRVPLLSHPDLLALSARARAGDAAARKRVILANLRLVVHVARGYRNRGLPLLDLIEEGNLGLIHATDRFEPERGLRFSTYASIWIRQSILRGVAEQANSVRIPVQMFQQMNRFGHAERTLRGRLGREPVIAEIAHELEISPVRAERLRSLIAGLRSMDEGSGLDAFEQLTHEDLGDAPPSVERLVELQLEHERLDRLLRSLSQREEQILRIRYGFYDGVARTLAQTGEHFGITRERVRQIESRALDKLRHALEVHDLERATGDLIH
jgi:RNA polymerase primary sigma factor